jgi:hypothetical protein
MSNTQVTYDTNPNNARSESSIAIDPNNPLQIVAGSKKFNNIATYDFTLATAYSHDGGATWFDSADIPIPGWDGISDPALTWDDAGSVYLAALPFRSPPNPIVVGIAVYKSTDAGRSWSAPRLIHTSGGDDKQWVAADTRPSSSYTGRVYVVWDDGATMRFARTLDHGATWIGTGTDPVGSTLVSDSFSPEINVSAAGTIYIVWRAGSTIKMLVSDNGGDSFRLASPPAQGIVLLDAVLPRPQGVPVLPGGEFRVFTLPTACAGLGNLVVAAWADFREQAARIYYAASANGGQSWFTGRSGMPLLRGDLPVDQHHFHPQMISDPDGIIACTFYEFGPKPRLNLIDVLVAQSLDGAGSFSQVATITDQPWDPAIDAPLAHGVPGATFIGDYFGIDASRRGIYPLWTDTRTGIQELWTDIVPAGRLFLEVSLWAFNSTGGVGTATIDLGRVRHFVAWAAPTFIDSLSDFDRDNAVIAEVLRVDGVETWKAAWGGDHLGPAGASSNLHQGAYVGYGRRVTFRLRSMHVEDLEVYGSGMVMLLD